jgi:SAM-dependent methyltransferase
MAALPAHDLREGVRGAYSAAALNPSEKHPFPLGRRFAEDLGYPEPLLNRIPPAAVEAFSGVSNVSVFAEIPPGATVLDLGCGAGMDSLIAAERVGPAGTVVGVDFSGPMLERAHDAQEEGRCQNLAFVCSEGEHLPFADGAIEVAIVNGIFNLNPARDAIFHELARVISPHGSVFAAELILRDPLPAEESTSEANWFA